MRELAADFTEIDFSDFQDYHYHVRRLLDLTYVKVNIFIIIIIIIKTNINNNY